MNLDKKTTFKILLIIFSAILFLVVISNISVVLQYAEKILAVLSPIIIGLCFAFILNLPLKLFENRCFARLNKKGGKKWLRAKRPVCLLLSVLLLFAIIALLLVIIIPQFLEALENFAVSLPGYMDALDEKLSDVITKFTGKTDEERFRINWENISAMLIKFVHSTDTDNAMEMTMDIISGTVKSIFNIILGFVISIYVLASKEKLAAQFKKLLYSLFKKEKAESFISVLSISNYSFSRFIVGQCTEAVLIGTLCGIGMIIFGMPYVPIVSCLIAITALIPVFGAFIGTAIGAFMILLVSPIKAIWFVVYIIILQQLETNIIYPKVVGKSVGLPGLWVLLSVTIGGGFFGAFGMLVSVPICSVLYTLIRAWVKRRLQTKNIDYDTLTRTDNSGSKDETNPQD